MKISCSVVSLSLLGLVLVAGCSTTEPQRYGSVIGVKAEKLDYYKELHANPWPGVLKMLDECNIHNYTIYLKKMDDGKHYLFSYFEYTGTDFDADMKRMASDETTRKWWKETDPCQIQLPNRLKPKDNWSTLEMVFLME